MTSGVEGDPWTRGIDAVVVAVGGDGDGGNQDDASAVVAVDVVEVADSFVLAGTHLQGRDFYNVGVGFEQRRLAE